LENHLKECQKYKEALTILPNEDEKYVSFKNIRNKIKCPFVLYADFECNLISCN